ncbi:ADP-ribosylglycohydrolase [Nocardioides alpinus]|uniref:ADP-ribosylglycohydrolase n=1 Tax=Nocardioides alpinus TaxID=748909 RepID=A0A1I0WCT5_9ACTN|nr:ADP-ribosylglycohydrolase family protein [Nocardioides alpinus]PKH37847.1 hypothetical protein CXG46_20875 [Nocardioides alpinus]SFA86559.1 ADP-ribosylglycohydrolase [Nocardioides alpinus]
MTTQLDAAVLDRVEGVLLGAACGDALGVPYEFGSAPLGASEAPRMIGGGLGPYDPGEWSDDTQMAVVIARVAAARGLTDGTALDDIVDGWVEWLEGGASDVGMQTRAILRSVAAGRGTPGSAGRALAAGHELHRRTGKTAGNGSLMRTAPVALAFLDDPASLTLHARDVSDLTHPDPVAGDACVLWCHAVRFGVVEGAMPDLADLVVELPAERRDQWAAWVAEADTQPPAAFAPNGYVVRAFQAAWSAVRHPAAEGTPLVASLTSAVHAGDDTDTVAAIAGALLGACWGAASVPESWLADVHGWPGLRADGLRDLARRVVERR